MELFVEKWGNSAALRLPTELLGMLKVALGDKLTVYVRSDGVLLKAKRPEFLLDELVAQCDTNALNPVDLVAWSDVKPVGREAR